jgi:hypothetical protein
VYVAPQRIVAMRAVALAACAAPPATSKAFLNREDVACRIVDVALSDTNRLHVGSPGTLRICYWVTAIRGVESSVSRATGGLELPEESRMGPNSCWLCVSVAGDIRRCPG